MTRQVSGRMRSGRFNEGETEAQKEKPKTKKTHKVTEQIHFSSWTLKWALSRGAAERLLPRGCDLPAPGVRSLLRRGGATEQSGETWRPGSGEEAAPALSLASPSRLRAGRTQVTWSPWRRPRVWGRHSLKPRTCLPPGPRS